MAVGYKEYGTCPKVWMIICVNSGGSPTEGAAKEGLFFLFLNMPAGKNQKQGSPPPRFAQGPEAFQDFATRLAKTAWLLFLSVHLDVYAVERGIGVSLPAVLGPHAYRSGTRRMQDGCEEEHNTTVISSVLSAPRRPP